jgi:hypothetical protein
MITETRYTVTSVLVDQIDPPSIGPRIIPIADMVNAAPKNVPSVSLGMIPLFTAFQKGLENES